MAVRLEGSRVLLTGASGGLGGTLARRLAAAGAQLVLTGRRAEVLDALALELGARAVPADLASREELERLLAAAGGVDILIANAALPASGRLAALEPDHVDRAIEVNLRAPVALAHRLAPAMVARGSGHLVFIGSLSGKAASGGASLYCATKFGLRGFALALRSELAPAGVGVSIVSPGFIADAGMFSDTAIKLPRGMSTTTSAQVSEAVVRAIVRNRGEIDVAAPAMRLGADAANLAPALAARVGRMIGAEALALQFEQRQADKR
ncbi:MAG TPA: SDR family NAD(P)-dependent oxidoreductase [Solirubrobacteraceae bacterium]|nr:SDR family NAD(P)-dependent oxidoreductase [Solirubrobacteraceae bacterium]